MRLRCGRGSLPTPAKSSSSSSHSFLLRFGSSQLISVNLERTSIFYQCHLFRSATVIIGQHGPALSNVFFMDSHSILDEDETRREAKDIRNRPLLLIEVIPSCCQGRPHFRNLASLCGIRYRDIPQDTIHSDVNVQNVVDIIKEVWR